MLMEKNVAKQITVALQLWSCNYSKVENVNRAGMGIRRDHIIFEHLESYLWLGRKSQITRRLKPMRI